MILFTRKLMARQIARSNEAQIKQSLLTSAATSFVKVSVMPGVWCLVLGLSLAADNWPQFRGPTGDGHSDAKGLPLTWSETNNVKWKTEIHDKGWSSPVIWGGEVWLTTASDERSSIPDSVSATRPGCPLPKTSIRSCVECRACIG